MNTEAKCECRHCGGHIKFEVKNFQAGMVVDCPHCGEKTALVLPFLLANAARLRIAVCIVLFIVAAIAIESHFKTLNDAMDKTGETQAKPFGDRARANAEAKAETDKAAADLNARLNNLTNSDTPP